MIIIFIPALFYCLQMRHLDRLDSHALLKTGLVPFLPFHGDELEDKEVLKEKFRLIVDNNPWIW